MKKLLLFFSFLLFVIILKSQDNSIIIDKTGDVHPWSGLEINNDPDNFQFAIITDRTGGHRAGIFEEGIRKLNLLQPEFVMSAGDMIEGYTRDREEIIRQWDEVIGFISELDMPWFYVPGNHDYINDVEAEVWKEKFGRSYYHFIYRDVLFLCLNSEEATKGSNMGGIEKEQYNYVKKVLHENQDVKWTLVFMHQPLWTLDNTRYWPEVEKLLSDRKHTVFAGHNHQYVKYQRNNGKYFILATMGGASRLRGVDYGEFDHVVWVTMTENGPVIANLMLNGIWDEDVVNEDIVSVIRAEPLHFDPLILNKQNDEKLNLRISIVNDEKVPMTAKISINNSKDLVCTENTIECIVEPGNTVIREVALSNNAAWGTGPEALSLSAIYSYEFENGRHINQVNNYNFSPSIIRKIGKVSATHKVDGNPAEWENKEFFSNHNEPYVSGDREAYRGREDMDFSFSLASDEKYLYALIRVHDDYISLDPDQSVWRQDALRFYIDGRPLMQSISGSETKNGDDYIGVFMSPPVDSRDEKIVYQPGNFPEGTLYECSYNGSEIFYEIGIPVSWLNMKAGGEWKNIRLNVGVNDVDNDGALTQVFWMPEWRSENNIIGSGIFEK